MKKTLGIFLTLIVLYGLTAWLGDGFLGAYNQEKLMERTALFGILGIGVAFVIITGGIDLSIGSVVFSRLIGQKKPSAVKLAPYECGMPPVGSARERFSVKFYLTAILFIIFDVEVVFLYPWALEWVTVTPSIAHMISWALTPFCILWATISTSVASSEVVLSN